VLGRRIGLDESDGQWSAGTLAATRAGALRSGPLRAPIAEMRDALGRELDDRRAFMAAEPETPWGRALQAVRSPVDAAVLAAVPETLTRAQLGYLQAAFLFVLHGHKRQAVVDAVAALEGVTVTSTQVGDRLRGAVVAGYLPKPPSPGMNPRSRRLTPTGQGLADKHLTQAGRLKKRRTR
jgi:hypothetical protein